MYYSKSRKERAHLLLPGYIQRISEEADNIGLKI